MSLPYNYAAILNDHFDWLRTQRALGPGDEGYEERRRYIEEHYSEAERAEWKEARAERYDRAVLSDFNSRGRRRKYL